MNSTVITARLACAALAAALFVPAPASANDSNDQRLRRQYGDSWYYGWSGPGYRYFGNPNRVYRPYGPGPYRYGYPPPAFVPPYRPYGGGPYGYAPY
jgi:hypothetical protein